MDTVQVLEQFSDVLKINDIVSYILNFLGFLIVRLLYFITSSVEGLVNEIFSLSYFFSSEEIQVFINSFKPVYYALLVGSIIWLGYTFFFKSRKDRSSLISNIFLSIVIITALPTFMIELNSISSVAINEFMPQNNSVSASMIKDNITDVLLYDENNFSVKNLNPKNYINDKHILNIDPNEVIDPAQTKNRNIFDSKLLYDENNFSVKNLNPKNYINDKHILNIDPNEVIDPAQTKNRNIFDSKLLFNVDGNGIVAQLQNRWYNFIWKEAYRRYQIDYISIFIGLISLALLFGFTIFKIARIYYELAIHQLLAILLAYSDLTGGVRLKKVLQSIFMSIFTLVFTVILLKIGMIGISYVSYHENVWVKLVFILVIAISTITGPALVEKILGVDIGSSNVAKGMATAYYTGQTVNAVGKSIVGTAVSGTNTAKKIYGKYMKNNIKKPNFTSEDIGRVSRNAEYLKSAERMKLDDIQGKTGKLETSNIHRLTTDETALGDNQGTVNISTEQGLGIKGLYSKDNESGLNISSSMANTKENISSYSKNSYTSNNRNLTSKRMPTNINSRPNNIPIKNLPNDKGKQGNNN